MTMHLLDLRLTGLLALTLGLSACPSDENDDSGEESGGSTTMTMASTSSGEGSATDTVEMTSSTGMGEGSTAADESTGELVLGDVEVTVIYEGEATGLLNVVAMPQWPPIGPPVAAVSEMDPEFPFMGTLNDIEAGDWYIVAVLDVGADNPTMPGPEDLLALTEPPITIDGPGPFMVELTLVDP